MKSGNLFVLIMIILIVIFEGIVLSDLVLEVNSGLEIEIGHHLEDISSSRSDRINDYLQRYRGDLEFLAESRDVKDILKKELITNYELTKDYMRNLILVYEKEVENYLLVNPNMTLSDLQKSEEFQKIAIFSTEKEGYTSIHGSSNLTSYSHKDINIVGQSFENGRSRFPELYLIMDEARIKGNASGYYSWVDINGVIREKFGDFKTLDIKTADGIGLIIGVTEYIDDYKIFKNISEKEQNYFKDFIDIKSYYNLMFISEEGFLAYMPTPTLRIGTNFNWEINMNQGVGEGYSEIKKDGGIEFNGPFYSFIYGQERGLLMSGMIPVEDDGEVVGYIAIIDNFNHITSIMIEEDALGETGDTYLVNSEKLLISPVRFSNLNVLIQEISNINVDECIEDLINNIGEKERDSKKYLNYRGEQVYGSGLPISLVDWCLISEIDVREVMTESNIGLLREIGINLGILFVFAIIILFTRKWMNKKYIIKKSKFFDKNKNVFDWRFIQRINLFWGFLIGIIFSAGIFYYLSCIFEGWKNLKLLDTLPDLFILVALFILIVLFFQSKKVKVRFFGALGCVILIISKVIEIFMQEFQFKYGLINTNIWTAHLTSFFLGMFLLLFAIREVCKK